MPMNIRDYPPHWRQFSLHIRFEVAHGRCQCNGECGQPHVCDRHHQEPLPNGKPVIIATVREAGR